MVPSKSSSTPPKSNHPSFNTGSLKSCGCERTRVQADFQRKLIARMSDTRCRRVADLVATEGKKVAAAKEGLWPTTIDFARRKAEAWLWSLDVQAIYKLAKRNFNLACDSYKLICSEVLHIVDRMRRMDAAVQRWWGSLSDADRFERQTDLADMTNGIASALRSLKQRPFGPSACEFSQREFCTSGKMKSYYKGLSDTLTATPRSLLTFGVIIGPTVHEFVDAVHTTIAGRSARRKERLRQYWQAKNDPSYGASCATIDEPKNAVRRKRRKHTAPCPEFKNSAAIAAAFADFPLTAAA